MKKHSLHIKTGTVILLYLFVLCVFAWGSETYVVTNNHDNGKGSFRYFVNRAHDDDSIRFAEPFVIALDSQVTIREKSIWIDGLVNNTRVQLNGQGKTRGMVILGAPEKFMHIRNLEFRNCKANFGGALKTYAMYEFCELIIENIDFNRNVSTSRGGAAVFAGGIVRNCMFFANHSDLDGGAVYANHTEIINCMFLGNTCLERGSAGVFHHNVEVLNSSFVMNEPDLFYTIEPAYFYNSLFWNEFPLLRSSQESHFVDCVTNGWNEKGIEIIDESPFVLTPDAGVDTIWGTWDDEVDLRMKYDNVCVNRGKFHEVLLEIDVDFNGNFRIIQDTIDIGAIEYDPTQVDSDDDGVFDSQDAYPLDPYRSEEESEGI